MKPDKNLPWPKRFVERSGLPPQAAQQEVADVLAHVPAPAPLSDVQVARIALRITGDVSPSRAPFRLAWSFAATALALVVGIWVGGRMAGRNAVADNDLVVRPIEVTNLDSLLDLYPSLPDALEGRESEQGS